MIRIASILPVRLYKEDDSNFAPLQSRNTARGYSGAKWVRYKQKWLINEPIIWRIEYTGTITPTASGGTGNWTVTDITPVGWQGDTVYEIIFEPIEEAVYYFEFEFTNAAGSTILKSECLIVRNELNRHVKIEYNHSENHFGVLFTSTPFVTFVEGIMQNVPMGGTIDSMTDSGGNEVMLKNTITEVYDLAAYNIPQWVAIQLAMVLTCDRLQVNNTKVVATDVSQISSIENTNNQELSITLQRRDWNYQNEYESNNGFTNTIATNNSGNYGINNTGIVGTSNN
jgi:hypothetical protein